MRSDGTGFAEGGWGIAQVRARTGSRKRTTIDAVWAVGREIGCEYFVNAGGMWARQLAQQSGVCVPNQAAEHYYLLTEAMESVGPKWPVVEDPSACTYIRPEGGGLMVGLFETDAAAWCVPRRTARHSVTLFT